MAETTGIAWTDATFNPWVGCTKVSPGCDRCYAEALDRRIGGGHWGPHAERRRTGPPYWNDPLRWNRKAEAAGVRKRVFCASMADVFDNAVPESWRSDLWDLIRVTPHLDWQLLTKRPQNIAKMLPADWGDGWPNVWLGTTAENQAELERRTPVLCRTPARVRFLSCEPMIERLLTRRIKIDRGIQFDALTGYYEAFTSMLGGFSNAQESIAALPTLPPKTRPIDWVICGGESGHGARSMDLTWALDLANQCASTGTPFFFKQIGSNHSDWPGKITGKGHDPAEWPAELRVQQFPVADA